MKTFVWSRSLASLLVLVGVFAWTMFDTQYVYACSCAPPGDTASELERSAAVFEGTVIAADEAQFITGEPRRITFTVTNIWKGIRESQVVLATGNGGGDCGFEFERGRDYVVYAYRTEPESTYGEGLATSICSRTKTLEASAEDIAALGQPTQPIFASATPSDAGVSATATATPASTIQRMTPGITIGLVSLIAMAGVVIFFVVRRRSS